MKKVVFGVSLSFVLFCFAGGFSLPERLTDEMLANVVGAGHEKTDCLVTGVVCRSELGNSVGGANQRCPEDAKAGDFCTLRDGNGEMDSTRCNDSKVEYTCQDRPVWNNWWNCKELDARVCIGQQRSCVVMGAFLVCVGWANNPDVKCGKVGYCTDWWFW